MHVAFVLDSIRGGGCERVVLELAKGLIDRGHKVDLVLCGAVVRYAVPEDARLFVVDNKPDRGAQETSGQVLARLIPLSAAPGLSDWIRMASALNWDPRCLPGARLARRSCAVACYMAIEKPDATLPSLHGSIEATLLAGCLPTRSQRVVVPIGHMSLEAGQTRRTIRRLRYLSSRAAHFVGVSQGVSHGLAKVVKVPDERITTIYNPAVTPDLHDKAAETPDHPWLRHDDAPVVLAVGKLEREKDYPTLLKAFARLAARRPCRLIILGEGSKRTEIEGLVEESRLTDRVSLPGWVENPFAFMARASLFVLSSRWEGFGMVLAEALACGCPCVSTDCPSGGPAEILLNGDLGPLVPVGDDAALAEAMERVLNRPPDRQALQRRAADFSADRAVDAYEKLIAGLTVSCTAKTSDDAILPNQ